MQIFFSYNLKIAKYTDQFRAEILYIKDCMKAVSYLKQNNNI